MFAASKTAGAVSAAPPASSDPQFNYVSLLLNDTGTNGQQNNTFLDSSSNNFTITRNGTPTQGSVTPYWPDGQWSNQFNGTNSVLNTTETAAFDMGSGNFTVELWAFPTATQTGGLVRNANSGSFAGFAVSWESSRFKMLCSYSGTSWAIDVLSSSTYSLNTWHHVAMVRNGSTVTLYVNGTSVATGNVSTNSLLGGQALYVGFSRFSSEYFNGYLSNMRVVKGTAIYTSNFTPSTTPLTAVSGTSLLTCQSNRFKDNSSNNFAITVTGTPTVQAFDPFSPAGSYSASLGGSYYNATASSNIKTPNAQTPLAFGTGNFTAEAWVYPTATPSSSFNGIIDTRNGGGLAFGLFVSATATFQVYMEFCAGGSNLVLTSASNVLRLNSWSHIAVTRSGTAVNVWVNGVSVSSGTGGQNLSDGYGMIGAANDSTSTNYFRGYISNVRLVKGTAVYTAAFTPPTSPVTAITNTSLLLNFTNAGIYDAATLNDLVTVGNAQVSTAVAKFGSSSMKFDGNGDYLSNSVDASLGAFGTGAFTVECWVYAIGISSSFNAIYDQRPTSTNGFYPTIYLANGTLHYFTNSANRITGPTLATNQWYHIAVCRSGTSTRMFVNGSQVGSTYTDSNNYISATGRPWIGQFSDSTTPTTTDAALCWNGYMDDLRITKGYARYTANFTPPTAPFPTR